MTGDARVKVEVRQIILAVQSGFWRFVAQAEQDFLCSGQQAFIWNV